MRRRGDDRPPMTKLTALRLLHGLRHPAGVQDSVIRELGRQPTADDIREAEALLPRVRGREAQ